MKCSNCGAENNINASFCTTCGNKLNNNPDSLNNNINNDNTQNNYTENNYTNQNNVQTTINPENNYTNQNNVQTTINTNNKTNKNKWITIGIIAAVVIVFIIGIVSNDSSSSFNSDSSYNTVNSQTKLGNILVEAGFTKNSSTNYTYYKDGYTYTFDFTDDVFSQENSKMYNAYYYKKDIFGTAMISGNLKVAATYTFDTYSYNCETEPTTYQTYTCNYMKPTITELATTIKNTFYQFVNTAGISVSEL